MSLPEPDCPASKRYAKTGDDRTPGEDAGGWAISSRRSNSAVEQMCQEELKVEEAGNAHLSRHLSPITAECKIEGLEIVTARQPHRYCAIVNCTGGGASPGAL